MKKSDKKENTVTVEEKTERKSVVTSLREWVVSLNLGKPQAVMLATTVAVMVAAFLIFNNLSVSYARRWDIDWGY